MWARIDRGVVAELTPIDPAGRFPSEMVWVSCPANTQTGETYDGTAFTPVAPPPAPEPTLADRLIALEAERYQRQAGGVMFKAAGAQEASLVASDPVSTGMLTASYVAARDGHWVDGTPWKMSDGTFVSLTSADMQAMAIKALGFISGCFAREGALAAALAADLTTDITQGWPANT